MVEDWNPGGNCELVERDENLIAIGACIQATRKQRGLSQEALAERLDVSRNYVGMIERGERNPTTLMLLRIARALHVHPKEFFEGIPYFAMQ